MFQLVVDIEVWRYNKLILMFKGIPLKRGIPFPGNKVYKYAFRIKKSAIETILYRVFSRSVAYGVS